MILIVKAVIKNHTCKMLQKELFAVSEDRRWVVMMELSEDETLRLMSNFQGQTDWGWVRWLKSAGIFILIVNTLRVCLFIFYFF